MAQGLDSQQQNFVSQTIANARDVLQLRTRLQRALTLYKHKGYLLKIDDESLAEVFSGLTQDELSRGVEALNAIVEALGDDDRGLAAALIDLSEGR